MIWSILRLLRVIAVLLWTGFTAIWMVVAAVVTFIAQIFTPSTEEKLRKLDKPS